MIISWEYFFGETEIAQATQTEVQTAIDLFIKRYEPKILECVLGNELYVEFKNGIQLIAIPDTDPVEYEPIAQKWINLRDGCDYTDKYGVARHWVGLANATTKQSLIANYVYFKYTGNAATSSTGSGERLNVAENSKMASPIMKQYRAWNQMVEWNKDLRLFMQSSPNDYPTWNDPLMRPRYCDCTEVFKTINPFNF